MLFKPKTVKADNVAHKTAVLLINLGTPDAPTANAVRRYLKQFLSDPRVVEIPKFIWWWILNLIILPLRSGKSAAKYKTIWLPQGSPLKVWTARQAELLQQKFADQNVTVDYAMRYGNPSIASALEKFKVQGVERILILPLYPQYSGTTSASSFDEVFRYLQQQRNQAEIRVLKDYHDHSAYINAVAESIRTHWTQAPLPTNGKLILSFHGVPERTALLGDPYYAQCLKTGDLLREHLGLDSKQVEITFQSRFGKARWLQPYTASILKSFGKADAPVQICCPGFPADCLETLEEIAIEGHEIYTEAGGKFFAYIPCLNDNPAWIEALHTISLQHLQGWPLTETKSNAEILTHTTP